MDLRDVEILRDELLDRMVEDFKRAYIAAGIAEEQNEGLPKIVRAILDEIGDDGAGAIGEYYFTPFETGDETVQHFNATLTLSEDIPSDNLPALYEAMSYINFAVPTGSFSYDKDHRFLCLRLSVPMPVDLGRETIYAIMNTVAANTAAVADAFMGVLMDVANNEMSVDEVMDFLGGRREEKEEN